jgi:hypothetical protein
VTLILRNASKKNILSSLIDLQSNIFFLAFILSTEFMKLRIETHREYLKLKEYFKNIEALAEKMGVDVDDLLQESRNNRGTMYTSFRRKISTLAQKRNDVFVNRNDEIIKEDSRLADLTILKNTK